MTRPYYTREKSSSNAEVPGRSDLLGRVGLGGWRVNTRSNDLVPDVR